MNWNSFVWGAGAVVVGGAAVAAFYEYQKRNGRAPDAFVPYKNSLEAFVATNGDDAKGTGSSQAPVQSIQKALDLVAESASPLQRGVVRVSPGTYDAPEGGWLLPPNVYVVGTNPFSTRLNGIWRLKPEWAGAGDHRSGWANVAIRGFVDGDMATAGSNEGKLYFKGCQLFNPNGPAVGGFHGASNITQIVLQECETFSDLEFYGCNGQMYNCVMQGGTLKVSDKATRRGLFVQAGGLRRNTIIEGLTSSAAAYLYGHVAGGATLQVVGGGATVEASWNALPAQAYTTVSGGATLDSIYIIEDPLWVPATAAPSTGSESGSIVY